MDSSDQTDKQKDNIEFDVHDQWSKHQQAGNYKNTPDWLNWAKSCAVIG